MPKLTLLQRKDLIRYYYLNNENAEAALRQYRRVNNLRQGPCKGDAAKNLIRKFEATGVIADAPRSGRPKLSEETVMEVGIAAASIGSENAHGENSSRAVSVLVGIPASTVWKILRKILGWFLYHIQTHQLLEPGDPARRLEFAQAYLACVQLEDAWPDSVLWSDEVHIYLHGHVNSKNCVIWAAKNPHAVHQVPLHDKKLTIWCGFTANFLIGPYFFEEVDANGVMQPTTVNGERYHYMLTNFLLPELERRNALENIIFMQDGATPHIVQPVQEFFRDEFGEERVISRMFPIAWPARSPDLTPCDFFLWGHLKNLIFQRRLPRDLNELRQLVIEGLQSISVQQLRAAVYDTIPRMNAILENDGGLIEHLL